MRSDRGFTIVELLVTMLILGVLVGIVVMTMTISARKARESACKANLRTLTDALILYRATHDGQYPPLVVGSEETTGLYLLTPYYIKGAFDWICPSGDDDYRVNYDGDGDVWCTEPGHEL